MDYNLGNQQTANVIEGAAKGFHDAAENLFNIQMAKAKLANETKTSDADIAFKHAYADKMEAEGQVTSLEADQMRDYINTQRKAQSAQADLKDATISTVEDRLHKIANAHKDVLASTLQTPQGQDYIQSKITGASGAPESATAQVQGGSPVVNAIMPGVGASDPQYNTQTPPPMSYVPGMQPQPTQQNVQAQPPVQQPQNQPVTGQQPTDQELPPLADLYKGLSTKPFGEDTNDLYMKNPNVVEAIKNGNYLVKKDQAAVQAQNPLSLNENDRTVLADVQDLKKAGYKPDEIFNQLTPGTQSLIKTIGEYRATPAQLTSSMGGGRQKQELVKAVQSFYPKWSDAIYDQRHKSLIDFTDPNGKNGSAIMATRQGIQHLDELTQSIDAVSNKTMQVGNRQVPVLNAGMNTLMQYVGGDPDILALKQNINAVSEEMTKAWGGASAGEGRLKNWRDTMSATNSPNGWRGLLSKTAKLWGDAAQARESGFSLAMGGQKMQDVLGESVLRPEDQTVLDRVANNYTPGPSTNSTKSSIPQYQSGEKRNINGVTYVRDDNGNWNPSR